MTTKQYLTDIKNNLDDISSILEIQCGGQYDIESCTVLQDANLQYFGIDIIDEKIRDNRQYFRAEKNKIFISLDASNEPLPKSDLVSCIGMSPYLPIANIWSLLENIRESEAKYFIFDHAILEDKSVINENISLQEEPQKRPINLSEFPFYFSDPILTVPISDNNHAALYDISQVGFFMDVISNRLAKLRRDIFNVMHHSYDNLEKTFIKEGHETLFKEMALGFISLNDDEHIQQHFVGEIYQDILHRNGDAYQSRNEIFRLIYLHGTDIIAQQYGVEMDDVLKYNVQIIATDYMRWRLNKSFFF